MMRKWIVSLALVLGTATVAIALDQTSPALTTTGVIQIRKMLGPLLFANGTSSAPAIAFSSETNTGFRWAGGNTLVLDASGTDVMQLGVGLVVRAQDSLSWGSAGIGSADTSLTRSGVGTVAVTGATITAGAGTGITVNATGALETQVYKVTVASTNFIANATTADVTLATLPAKTTITWMIADLTQTFACASTCTTATLSMTCGKTAGGAEYLVSFDADAATGQFGDAQAELGTALKTATPPVTPLGDLPSWAGTTAVQCRLTSGTGAVGTGAATNLSQGSLTFYLLTTRLP